MAGWSSLGSALFGTAAHVATAAASAAFSITTGALAASMIAYSGYVLYDTAYVEHQAYASTVDLLAYRPTIIEDEAVPLTGASLSSVNEDYRAWLVMDGTKIDYPVMQGENDLYYVSHDVYKNSSLSGAIYFAAANSPDLSDSYNLVYGHHMDNGAMFGGLDAYCNETYLYSHRTGTLATGNTAYDLTVFAVAKTDAYEWALYDAGDRMEEVLAHLKNPSEKTETLFYDEATLGNARQIIALSTCASADTNGRLIVFATMTPRQPSPTYMVSGGGYEDTFVPNSPSGTPRRGLRTFTEGSFDGGPVTTPDGTPIDGTETYPDGTPIEGTETYPGGTPVDRPGSYPNGTPIDGPGTSPDGTPISEAETYPDGTPINGPGTNPNGTPIEGTETYPDGTPVDRPGTYPDGTPISGTETYPDGTPIDGPGTYPDGTPIDGPGSNPNGTPISGLETYPDGTPINGPGTYPDGTPIDGTGTFPDGTPPDDIASDENGDDEPLIDIQDMLTPLSDWANRFQPAGASYNGRAWALINLVALAYTLYLLFPLTHSKAKFFRGGTMKKINRAQEALFGAEDLTERELLEKTMIEREAVKDKAREDGGDAEAALREAEAASFAEVTEEEFTAAADKLYYQVKRFTRRFRAGLCMELVIAALAALAFFLTEDMRLPMTLIDKWTPLMLVFLAVCWVADVRLARYRGDKLWEDQQRRDEAQLSFDNSPRYA